MKLNLEYYKEELDLKPIGEEYMEVLEKVEKCEEKDVSKMLDRHAKVKNILALSDVRENILNWYDFKEEASILELNANYGEITGLLCKKAKKVVSIESSRKYASIIEKRHGYLENLELVVGNYTQIPLQEKFDYIILMGMVEELPQAFSYAKEHLKENGIILLAVNNQFGVKAWITTKEDSKVTNNRNTAITKERLEALLQDMHYQYYYPLPDYKLPNVIYTEKNMPTINNIYRDLTYKDENVNFKEVDAYREIIQNCPEDFKKFANSFLVEISHKEIATNDMRFITFSNIRKDEYRIQTIVREKEVYKTGVNGKANKHIQKVKKNIDLLTQMGVHLLDTYQENKIISQYVEAPTLEDALIKLYQEQGKEAFIQVMQNYKEFLKEKLVVTNDWEKNVFEKYKVEVEKEELEKMTFVKHGLWDLIFQNCFIIDNEYYFYDQEWYEENLPVEYILYRAIVYFHESKRYLADQELFEAMHIEELIPLLKELDDKIQAKIRKALAWNIHSKEELEKNKYARLKQELQQKEQEMNQLKNELASVKAENIQRNTELASIQNSFSWRITKPLRAIRRMTNKK